MIENALLVWFGRAWLGLAFSAADAVDAVSKV